MGSRRTRFATTSSAERKNEWCAHVVVCMCHHELSFVLCLRHSNNSCMMQNTSHKKSVIDCCATSCRTFVYALQSKRQKALKPNLQRASWGHLQREETRAHETSSVFVYKVLAASRPRLIVSDKALMMCLMWIPKLVIPLRLKYRMMCITRKTSGSAPGRTEFPPTKKSSRPRRYHSA